MTLRLTKYIKKYIHLEYNNDDSHKLLMIIVVARCIWLCYLWLLLSLFINYASLNFIHSLTNVLFALFRVELLCRFEVKWIGIQQIDVQGIHVCYAASAKFSCSQ